MSSPKKSHQLPNGSFLVVEPVGQSKVKICILFDGFGAQAVVDREVILSLLECEPA